MQVNLNRKMLNKSRLVTNNLYTEQQPSLWKDEQCPLLKLTVFIYGRLMCFAHVIVVVIWKAQNGHMTSSSKERL